MNRIVMMVLRNIFYVPGAWIKLRRYAKHTDKYSREESYAHIHDIMKHALRSSNVDLKVTGLVCLTSWLSPPPARCPSLRC